MVASFDDRIEVLGLDREKVGAVWNERSCVGARSRDGQHDRFCIRERSVQTVGGRDAYREGTRCSSPYGRRPGDQARAVAVVDERRRSWQ